MCQIWKLGLPSGAGFSELVIPSFLYIIHMSSQLIWTNQLFCLALGLIHNLPSQHLHRNILITATISAMCRWPWERRIQQQNDRLSPSECDQFFFSPAKDRKKTVISISILIHIYIEMNPDANERNGTYLKQVPPGCTKASTGVTQRNIKSRQACQSNAMRHFSQRKEGKSKAKHLNTTRELMSCLGNPLFDKQNRHALGWRDKAHATFSSLTNFF